MQKKLIALAVAGIASSGAFAQMNVTVYGAIDLMIMEASGTSRGTQGQTGATESGVGISGITTATEIIRGRTTQMVNGTGRTSSVLGFKGTEDLGGGLKAHFIVESDVVADGATGQAAPTSSGTSGAGLVGNRDTSIEIEGSLGKVKFGRQKMWANDKFGLFDATGDKGAGSFTWLLLNGSNSTVNNSIKYTSPNLSGNVVTYQVAMSEDQDLVNAVAPGTLTGLSWNYDSGPVGLMVSQLIARDIYGLTANGNTLGVKMVQNHVGAAYDFGVAKLMGQYVTTRSTDSRQLTTFIDARTYNIAVTAPMGAHLFRVNYVATDDKRPNNADGRSWMLGYDYALSKRTSLYLGAANVNNSNGAQFSANADTTAAMTGVVRGSGAAGTAATAAIAGRTNAYYAGMFHKF